MSYQTPNLAGKVPPFISTNAIQSVTKTVSSGTVLILTKTSTQQQYITGSTAQTIRLPVETTLPIGQSFTIINASSAIITVQSSNTSVIVTIDPGATRIFTVFDNTILTNAAWNFPPLGVTSVTGTANQVGVSASTGAVTFTLPQDIATFSSPTFSQIRFGNGIQVGNASSTALRTSGIAIGKGAVVGQSSPTVTTQATTTNISPSSHVNLFNSSGDQTLQTVQVTSTFNLTTIRVFLNQSSQSFSGPYMFALQKGSISPNTLTGGSSFVNISVFATAPFTDLDFSSLGLTLTPGPWTFKNIAPGGFGGQQLDISGAATTDVNQPFSCNQGSNFVWYLTFFGTQQTGFNSIAIGQNASSFADGAIAIGQNVTANIADGLFLKHNTYSISDSSFKVAGFRNGTNEIVGATTLPSGLIPLPANQIFVGNGSNLATPVSMSGNATINSAGVVTLSNTGVTPGTYGSATQVPVFQTNSQGRIISVTNTTIPTTPVGVSSLTTNTGLSTNVGATGNVTITNTGVTSITTNSGLSTNVSATGNVTITNTGVISLSGTTNQIDVFPATGNSIASLPNQISIGSGYVSIGSANNLAGIGGVCIGTGAATNIIGLDNVVIGNDAGNAMINSQRNVIIGDNAAPLYDGNDIVSIGKNACASATNGLSQSSFLGSNVANNLTNGSYNTFFGNWVTGQALTSGSSNALFGTDSGAAFTSGDRNTLVGAQAGIFFTSGSDNTFIGMQAGQNLSMGDYVTCIGSGSQPSGPNANQELTLGNSGLLTLRCAQQTIMSLSDRRDKNNIVPLTQGLDFVSKLQPVRFYWNMRDGGRVGIPDTGFIAQDLQQVQIETEIIPGLVYEANPDKLEASYAKLIPVLVKSIQDLKAIVDKQSAEIESLKSLNK